jgi:hypothetical protein
MVGAVTPGSAAFSLIFGVLDLAACIGVPALLAATLRRQKSVT